MRETEYRAEDSLSVYSGRHTKVAIVAGGIDARHPQLAKLAGGIELAINKAGRVISGMGAALVDRAGHGTACAGLCTASHRLPKFLACAYATKRWRSMCNFCRLRCAGH